jgi:3-hydroxyacyl-CoA dehydrogenase
MSELVSMTRDGEVAVITVDNPPVNALSPGVPEGIGKFVQEANADDSVKAIVLRAAGQTFIAGADIREFQKIFTGEAKREKGAGLNSTLDILEGSAKPVVVAIHGTAFGGGLEFAMACHYRIAAADAQVGQPEVKLGIIPGAGGTQRLPRLAGVMKAVEMCAQGDPVKAPEALKLGILDELAEGDLREAAVAAARRLAAEGKPPRRTRDLTDKLGDEKQNAMVFQMARQMAQQKAKGMLAPLKAIDAVEAATKLPFDEGVQKEQDLFIECIQSPQARAMVHLFFGQREVAKVPGLAKDTPVKEIKKAGVVGSGLMGGGIAMVYANAGIPVVLKDVKQEFLDKGMATIRGNWEGRVKKGKMTQEKLDKLMASITPTLDYSDFKDVDIVVEAVFEEMDLKKQIFADLDKSTKPDAILASNTSTLDIDEIASATSRPQQVIGHHFFSPANVMQLLEIVRGSKTSDEVIATSMQLAKKLRKVGVLVGNCPGFVGNRMIGPYAREAQFLAEEGAAPQQIDKALTDFGMAMGALAMSDLAGIDTSWRVKEANKKFVPAGQRVPRVIDKLYAAGRLGQKSGSGWYKYEAGNRKPVPDPEVDKMIEEAAKEGGIERRQIDDAEIVERTIYALINEGARILDEGMAMRSVDIDIIYIFGYGFPPFRGGPMKYADEVGLKKVYERISDFHKRFGDMWKPADLLKRLADEGKSFAQFDRDKAKKATA